MLRGGLRREPIDGSEFLFPADQVVKAIGQEKPSLASLLGLATKRDSSR